MQKEVSIKKRKLFKSSPKPTSKLLPTLDEVEEVMRGVGLWETDNPPPSGNKGTEDASILAYLISFYGREIEGNILSYNLSRKSFFH